MHRDLVGRNGPVVCGWTRSIQSKRQLLLSREPLRRSRVLPITPVRKHREDLSLARYRRITWHNDSESAGSPSFPQRHCRSEISSIQGLSVPLGLATNADIENMHKRPNDEQRWQQAGNDAEKQPSLSRAHSPLHIQLISHPAGMLSGYSVACNLDRREAHPTAAVHAHMIPPVRVWWRDRYCIQRLERWKGQSADNAHRNVAHSDRPVHRRNFDNMEPARGNPGDCLVQRRLRADTARHLHGRRLRLWLYLDLADRPGRWAGNGCRIRRPGGRPLPLEEGTVRQSRSASRGTCLLYTSDAADERSSVDLGGRRIIKKKTPYHGLRQRLNLDI